MTNWNEMFNKINASGSTHDIIRHKCLKRLNKLTNRNIIIYYSGWLQKPNIPGLGVTDEDKTGFMSVVENLNPDKGLDIFLHTPGGDTAATESIVTYLKSIFGSDMRAFVPELAMSAGTMMACACKEIRMGKHSSLGPIDPQFNGIPAHGIIEEFERAAKEIKIDQSKIYIWQPIIAKYNPTLIGECEKAIVWSEEMVKIWLKEGMFKKDSKADDKIKVIIKELGDHALTKSHARHLSYDRCDEIGLKVISLEKDKKLRDAVLSVHYATIHTLTSTPAFKIIENHSGTAFIKLLQNVIVNR
ncbi:MAG: ATP-dependent Clp protease proteolytic subunit [Candidatus Micrarchaeia archaeon]|jgi:ATP-dependent protease ClpP protease subunit